MVTYYMQVLVWGGIAYARVSAIEGRRQWENRCKLQTVSRKQIQAESRNPPAWRMKVNTLPVLALAFNLLALTRFLHFNIQYWKFDIQHLYSPFINLPLNTPKPPSTTLTC
ncbi:hypothetical protein A4D02_07795 [Niastella koreensis]|uniref:Uncharacterized protein n=2 Tax=Niastella koreensis TaxID=354356 RepID=G8TL57_NIAKG|nr:hypothetical protein Niako_5666 [Niastella koreensis GR20-10]OQP48602.1 hypothetical protein A4D02_07795 [Niastella koreensis]